MATKKLEEKIDDAAKKLESQAESWAKSLERKTITWLRTSQFFDGMVNTPARILIHSLSLLAIYVWGFIVFESEDNFVPWVMTLFVLLLMQAASVRFVFSGEGIADELQRTRRDRAYRKAYGTLLRLSAIPLALFSYVLLGYRGNTLSAWEFITYRLDSYRSLTLAVFVFAVIIFQKYFSYGSKGEPFTVREAGKIKD